jgi:hypothetical protein
MTLISRFGRERVVSRGFSLRGQSSKSKRDQPEFQKGPVDKHVIFQRGTTQPYTWKEIRIAPQKGHPKGKRAGI